MKISVRWLNEYLDPASVTAEGAEQVLTNAGFPIETSVQLPNGDVMLDVEITSNRGDGISHIGLAREIAAATGRRLRLPKIPPLFGTPPAPGAAPVPAPGESIHDALKLENRVPDVCPLFTARVIRNVKVGPSPQWMVDALEAVGQRSINNIVDITNYVLFEFGQPLHVFDLAKLRSGPGGGNGGGGGKPQVIVRYANDGEKLTLLDGKTVTLRKDELVVADAASAVSLAGIMGGAGSEVTSTTTDVLLEAATWDPVTIRRASRRLQLRTDSSYRFERMVDPRTIDLASRRAAALIVQHGAGAAAPGTKASGPRLLHGALSEGAPPEPATHISMRAKRCRDLLGLGLSTSDMMRALRGHDIQVTHEQGGDPAEAHADGGTLECIIPAFRPDLTREIDLIEEVARTHGLARLPIHEKIAVRVAAPQVSELAMRELGALLTGVGFFETVTFSFISPKAAEPFLPPDLETVSLCDERRKADPALRPSILPSLLDCRRANQDGGVTNPGGVRLYEVASIFAQTPPSAGARGIGRGQEIETRVLSLLADALPVTPGGKAFDARQDTVRLVRGVLEAAAHALGGADAKIEVSPAVLPLSGFDPAASAELRLGGQRLGVLGLISAKVQQSYDLHTPVVAAEVNLGALLALYPPRSTAHALPAFPGIERDLSLIVGEEVPWASIEGLIAGAKLERLDGWEFVTAYRGQQAGPGRKSVTVRLKFRDPLRTLRHEEVDPQVGALAKLAGDKLGATLRT
jgi:phenylalanyl-tRNA synthetase beta chain